MLVNYLIFLEKLNNGTTLKLNFTSAKTLILHSCSWYTLQVLHRKKTLKQMDLSPIS